MALDRLRRYDVQATYACALSLLSIVPALGGLLLTYRNYHNDLGQIIYGEKGSFLPALATCVLTSLIPAGVGFALGWSSAGQRRNDKPTRSWVGFFTGGAVLTLDLILVVAFVMLRFEQPA